MENRNTPQENLAVIEYLLDQRNTLRKNLEAYSQASQRDAEGDASSSSDGLEDANQIQDLTRALKDANIVIAMKEKTIDLKLDETRELYKEIKRLKASQKSAIELREEIISSQKAKLDELRRYKCETERNNHDNQRWDFENEGATSIED